MKIKGLSIAKITPEKQPTAVEAIQQLYSNTSRRGKVWILFNGLH